MFRAACDNAVTNFDAGTHRVHHDTSPLTDTRAAKLLSGTRYGVRSVTVGEDKQSGRVRRHGEHDQRPPRNARLTGGGSVITVTVAGGGDPLSHSRFRTVWYQHDLAPSPVWA